ncbi:MAG: uroporphyrinogen decarboxylase family protein [Clostridia bacterium]|nr:uroporphyrinogen decarboxylase family protein [Clostridia bacterium]
MEGIDCAVPEGKLTEPVRILRNNYKMVPGARIYRKEWGYYCLERWIGEGHIPEGTTNSSVKDIFRGMGLFDGEARHRLTDLGGIEAPFEPFFEEKVLEDRGDHELVQDIAGRKVLYFKGRRDGFMPEYEDHPVKDHETWERLCKWRMVPDDSRRFEKIENSKDKIISLQKKGFIIAQIAVGGYMYLRSLMGPLELLYMVYDNPGLVHECMRSWFDVADSVTAYKQRYYNIDEFMLLEDICYNKASLISPEMIREFLFPYYSQLIENIKKRQRDKSRHLYVQLDTDGHAPAVIDLYKEIGVDIMSPFEVAAGCDVVEIGRNHPGLMIEGGIDKRIIAKGKPHIDRHLEEIMPAMRKRGGYIPTCDHGVPAEVSFEDYVYFRERLSEYCL